MPFIEGTTLINMREYGPDNLQQFTVGEQPAWATNRNYNGHWSMPAGLTGRHLCERRWFATGEPWPTSLPPTEYDDFWIPTCCGNFDHVAEGGFEIGGPITHAVAFYHSPTGGYAIGGPITHAVAFTHTATGGVALGGAVVHATGFEHTATGGVVFGGAVVHDFVFHHAPAGGVVLGGEVEHLTTYEHTATGGVEVGSEVVHEVAFTHAPAGGVEVGGALVHQFAFHHAPAGGVVLGGAVVHTPSIEHRAIGGVVLGGAVVHAVAFTHAPAGGAVLGGGVVHALAFTHHATGGVVLGGAITHTFNPGGPTPGTSCAGAGAISIGATYSGHVPSTGQDWFKFPETSGTSYTVTVSGVSGFSVSVTVLHGTCPTPSLIGAPQNGNGAKNWTGPATDTAFFQIGGVSGSAYTIHLTSP